jgi:predicted DNA-binding protein
MSKQIHLSAPDELHQKLEQASERTGLTKSEITRDGILKKIRELEE